LQISRISEFHHRVLKPLIRVGDTVVDCTVGNGYDALFLAETVGRGGRLYGFDVQEEALARTRSKLLEAGVEEERFTLIRKSHAELDRYVPDGIGAAVYNLGYLPGGERTVVTGRDTSIMSISKALELLRPEGVVSVTLYYGHDGGREEAEGVMKYARALDHTRFKVAHISYPNLPKEPPSILLLQHTPLAGRI